MTKHTRLARILFACAVAQLLTGCPPGGSQRVNCIPEPTTSEDAGIDAGPLDARIPSDAGDPTTP